MDPNALKLGILNKLEDMAGRDALRAPVTQSQDPLQISLTQPDTWTVPRTLDPSAATSSCQELALRGSWRAIAERTASFLQHGSEAMFRDASWHVVALMKLREYPNAAEALVSLGDLDSQEYFVSTSQGPQSRVPFALRLAECEIPAKLARWKDSQDAYYRLLHLCRQRVEPSPEGGSDDGMHGLWREREERVVAALFCQHLRMKDYHVALTWLAWLGQRHEDNLSLLCTRGRLQLLIGHTQAAAATFQEVANMVAADPESSPESQLLPQMNKGLLLYAQGNTPGALAEFKAISTALPENPEAANNKAICLLYSGTLTEAVQVVEGCLQESPSAMLHEAIFRNLGSMYDLYSPLTGQASKRGLSNWALHIAPDDFDLSFLQ